MGVSKHRPIFPGVVETLLLLVGLGVGLELDGVAKILSTFEYWDPASDDHQCASCVSFVYVL
jgi:hypothetical protein